MDFGTIIDAISIVVPIIIALFGAKWGVDKIAKGIAAKALTGKKYLKEIDDVLTAASEDLADGDLSTADLKRLLKEAWDIPSLIRGVNETVKK